MPTFTFNNQSEGSSYVVLDPEFATSPIPSSTPKYFSETTFSSFSNISRDDIVVNDYKLGIVVPEGNSSFEFTSSIPLPTSDVIIRGAGDCSVVYQDGATTINVTPDELNRRESGSSSAFTNPFCFEFNGNSDSVYVAGNTTALDLTGEISISTWVTIDADVFNTGSGEKDYYIVDKLKFPGGGFVEGYALYIKRAVSTDPTTVKLRAVFGVSNNKIFQCTCQVDIQPGATNELAPNTPYYIVATFDPSLGIAGQMKLFINGVNVKIQNHFAAGTFTPAATENFIIGNASSGPGIKEYHGKIDEVSIWDTVLRPTKVTELYNWNTNGNLNNYVLSSSLKGWYRMGENATFDTGSGNWTLKSATDPDNDSLKLTSTGVAQTDRKTPGLVGPA